MKHGLSDRHAHKAQTVCGISTHHAIERCKATDQRHCTSSLAMLIYLPMADTGMSLATADVYKAEAAGRD